MKRTSLVFAFLWFAFVSFGQKLTPVQIDKEIMGINDTLRMKGQEWLTELGNSVTSFDFSALMPLRKGISSFLDEKIEYLNNIKDVSGSQKYREAELEFLKYELDIVKKVFVIFEKFDSTNTIEQVQDVVTIMNPISEEEEKRISEITALQKEYAKRNNLNLNNDNIKD